MKPIPEESHYYNCFDLKEITKGRSFVVQITEIVPFASIDTSTLEAWKNDIKETYWLFAPETDFFVKAKDEDNETHVFARTKAGGWFSLGDWLTGAFLDVDGELINLLELR